MSMVHHPLSRVRRVFVAAGCLAGLATAAHATKEWPGFRGPAHGGPAALGALPEPGLGLELAWQHELGSGYSSIAIAQGTAVTLFTSGAQDVLAAFELATGKEKWRLVLGEKYAGHDGSDDGPISTPAIEGNVVYALGPRGALLAADLASGKELWRKQLDQNNATVPFYGFTASPLVHGNLVILPTGGKGHAITAFDKATGATRWTGGDDGVAYQSAQIAKLGGRDQVVVVTNQWVQGLAPADGKLLWRHQIATGNVNEESAHVTEAGKDRLIVDLNGSSIGLQIGADHSVKEIYTTQAFANTLALPVYSNGSLYGFTGRFLTAVDAQNGQIRWRSRPPGGQNLTLIDQSLAVVDPEGNLVLAAADPKEYREIGKIKALDRGDYAAPAYADGYFVVRNLSQIAAVRTTRGVAPSVKKADAPKPAFQPKGQFGQFLAKVMAAPVGERQAMVDRYFEKSPDVPIVEADGTAHIVYRGKAQDVGVAGGFLPDGTPDVALTPVEGTDLFFHALELDKAGNFEYALTIDFADPGPDPKNPHGFDDGFQQFSELRMPGFPNLDHLKAPADDAPKGEVLNFDVRSDALDNTRRVSVYLPPAYRQAEGKFPLLVVNHGDRAQRAGLYPTSLDNLIGQGKMAPVVAVFVPRAVGAEYGGPAAANYVKFLVDELLPQIDKNYKTDPARRALIGVGSAGTASAFAWVSAPKAFGQAAIQSFYLNNDEFRKVFYEALAARPREGKALVEWSRQDYELPRSQIQSARDSKELILKLKERGIAVEELESAGSANWQRWRGYTAILLPKLFPPAAKS